MMFQKRITANLFGLQFLRKLVTLAALAVDLLRLLVVVNSQLLKSLQHFFNFLFSRFVLLLNAIHIALQGFIIAPVIK